MSFFNKKNTREEVNTSINKVREYQDKLSEIKNWDEVERVPAKSTGDFLTLIRAYSVKADLAYSDNVGDEAARDVIRKIGAICVQCLEENGVVDRKI